jgi:quinol monooxygenase YgiN
MFIAILDLRTRPDDRSAVQERLEAEQGSIRSMPGCVDMRVFPSPRHPSELTVLHEWEDQASFTRYLDSESFRRSGELIRPLLVSAPISRRFTAQLVETVA